MKTPSQFATSILACFICICFASADESLTPIREMPHPDAPLLAPVTGEREKQTGGFAAIEVRLQKALDRVLPQTVAQYRFQKQDEGLALEESAYASTRARIAATVSLALTQAREDKQWLLQGMGGPGAVKSAPAALHRFSTLEQWERTLVDYASATATAFETAEQGIAKARRVIKRDQLLSKTDPEPGFQPNSIPDLRTPDLPEPPAFTQHLDETQSRQALEGLDRYPKKENPAATGELTKPTKGSNR